MLLEAPKGLNKNDFCWRCEDFGVCMMCMKVENFWIRKPKRKKREKKMGEGWLQQLRPLGGP